VKKEMGGKVSRNVLALLYEEGGRKVAIKQEGLLVHALGLT